MEMKKEWVRPLTTVQQFVPNEYCSSCGKTEYGKYRFECNAPKGELYYYDDNHTAHKLTGFLTSYHPCGETHETDSTSDFKDGFVDYNYNGKEDGNEAVIVWLEYNRFGRISDAHATTNLDREYWETQKS